MSNLFEKFLNKYCVVWFTDSQQVRKAKGLVTSVTEKYIELVDKNYGSIVINLDHVIKISNPKGELEWKTQG